MVDARRALGVAAAACLLAVTGCTADGPAAPSPSPSPAAQTPTETSQERQQRLDYAAAEKSYRTFRAEYNRVLRAGGAKAPTKVMMATAGGDYLGEFRQIVEAFDGLGDHQRGDEVIKYVRPSGYSTSELLLDVCEDGRAAKIISKKGRVIGSGEIRTAAIRVKRVGQDWKLWTGSGRAVKSCE